MSWKRYRSNNGKKMFSRFLFFFFFFFDVIERTNESMMARSYQIRIRMHEWKQRQREMLVLVFILPRITVKLFFLWSSRFRFPMDEKKTNEYSTSFIDHSIFVRSNRDQGNWSIEWIIALVVVVIIIVVVLVRSFFPSIRTATNLTDGRKFCPTSALMRSAMIDIEWERDEKRSK